MANKNGIDYERAREIGRRVAEGEVRVRSEAGRVLGTASGQLSQGLQAIYRGNEKSLHEVNAYDEVPERSTPEEIAEGYASAMGCFYDEEGVRVLTDGRKEIAKKAEFAFDLTQCKP